MVKILTGMPGIKSRSTISGRSPSMVMSSERAPARRKLHLPESHFYGKTTLKENNYWFMGKSPFSFDSRYWGL
ncbi:S26 family signal peptidase [Salmonella enterica subsp. enterica serovar Senftenberg]|nr:S26 family signal peptidase [Salmonella enterica subsp. enterica serovar Senftenberg]